jgi:hypothetical protein
MNRVYIYYESKNIKDNETTTIFIKAFKTWEKARKFMNERRKELINEYGLVPDSIDGNGDKTWVRLYRNQKENDYIDLITEEEELV